VPNAKFHGLNELVRLQKQNNPQEMKYPVIWREAGQGTYEKGAWFFDRWVILETLTSAPAGFHGHKYGPVDQLPTSVIAARLLENIFGRQEDVFVVDSAPLAQVLVNNDGYSRHLAWDPQNDRIIARTKEGITLSINGSNLVEAAIWLPRLYEQMKQKLSRIPEGVQRIDLNVERGAEWSKAASPLVMECRVGNFRNLNPFDSAEFDQAAAATFDRAVANRL